MRLDRKLLWTIAPLAVAGLFASEPAKDPRWHDAEARYRIKYGRSYPTTERSKMLASDQKKKSDETKTAQDNKAKNEKQQQEGERSRSR